MDGRFMSRLIRVLAIVAVVAFAPMGCEDSADDEKQPQMQGNPDPNIKGPATPGGGGAGNPGDAAL